MRRLTPMGPSCTSSPHTDTRPDVGGMKPVIHCASVVDLPAPLGPRKPSTSPCRPPNETPSTASFGPKDLLRFSHLDHGTSLTCAIPPKFLRRRNRILA